MTRKLPWRAKRTPIVDEAWRDRAACAHDLDPVWITAPHKADTERVEAALWRCAGCPVVEQCRARAEADDMFEGVAGGATWVDVFHARGVGRPRVVGDLREMRGDG